MISNFENFIKENITRDISQINSLLSVVEFYSFKKHQTILAAGDVCSSFYYIVKGGGRVFFLTPRGQEKTRFIT